MASEYLHQVRRGGARPQRAAPALPEARGRLHVTRGEGLGHRPGGLHFRGLRDRRESLMQQRGSWNLKSRSVNDGDNNNNNNYNGCSNDNNNRDKSYKSNDVIIMRILIMMLKQSC